MAAQKGLSALNLLLSQRGAALVLAVLVGAILSFVSDGFHRRLLIAALAVLGAYGLGVSFDFSLSGFVKEVPVVVALLPFAFLFRQQLGEFIGTLAERLQSGSVDLHLSTFQIKLDEAPAAGTESPARSFSRSPFEIQGEAVVDESGIRFDLAPQIQLPVTDYVAQMWTKDRRDKVKSYDRARQVLSLACKASADGARIRRCVNDFAAALQQARFLGAENLLLLQGAHEELRSELEATVLRTSAGSMGPPDPRDLLTVHCIGVAYALEERWREGRDLLQRLLEVHGYLPAADTFLACLYNAYIDEESGKDGGSSKEGRDIDTATFIQWFEQNWVVQARYLERLFDSLDWSVVFSDADKAFHKRELLKVIGEVYAMVAENFEKRPLFKTADRYLRRCVGYVDGEPGSALDFNNLADLYYRMGEYANAHVRLNRAFELSPDHPNPLFYMTRAQILQKQAEPWQGIEVLLRYTEESAAKGSDADVRTYIENQVFAAKLAVTAEQFSVFSLTFAVGLLERARRFVEKQQTRLGKDVERRMCEIGDLLGAGYLRMPDQERPAIAALEWVRQVRRPNGSESEWRRKIALARAHIRLARADRQRLAPSAIRHRQDAQMYLNDTLLMTSVFPVVATESPGRANRRFRLHLDALTANQELAEENFYQNDLRAATLSLRDVLEPLRNYLETFIGNHSDAQKVLGDEAARFRSQLERYRAQAQFLSARISARSDTASPDTVRAAMQEVRGMSEQLDQRVDLELGSYLLLTASATKERDKKLALYDDAVAALESAAAAASPKPRLEALRLLKLAYLWRASAEARARTLLRPAS